MITLSCYSQQFAYKDIYDFGEQPSPCAPGAVSFDQDGNMYGVTFFGGSFDEGDNPGGTVWEITSSGAFEVLHNFGGTITDSDGESGPDGSYPGSPILIDGQGNLFGATSEGGDHDNDLSNEYGGIIWEITASGVYKDLHDFGGTITKANGQSGTDGTEPQGLLHMDASGDLYGIASGLPGMIWELSASGVYTDIHDFGGQIIVTSGNMSLDGERPMGGVSADSVGNLFGTAFGGGPHFGMLWELTAGGTYKDLHDFGATVTNADGSSGQDGRGPESNVLFDAFGNMYGTASYGGPTSIIGEENSGDGMVWELTAGGVYKDLHDFGGNITNANGEAGPDGQLPDGQIAIDPTGALFGTTTDGGPNHSSGDTFGVAWEFTAAGKYSDLHDFGGTVTRSNGSFGTDGAFAGGATLGPNGRVYGECAYFQNVFDEGGMVWEMLPQRIEGLTLSPSTIGGLGTSTGTVTLAGSSPTGWTVNLRAGASGYLNLPASITVAAGAMSATFTITGTAQRSATLNMGIIATGPYTYMESILTIQGDEVNGLSFSPPTIGGSGSTTASVTIASAAPPGGWVINLKAAASGYLSMPASVTIPAGATSTTFTISGTTQRTGTAGIGVIASDGNASVESILTVQGDLLKSITLSPTSMGWSGTSTATLTLNSPAPEGGWVVNLKAGAAGYMSMPSSVTVPAGATSATFSITGVSQRSESLTIGVIANDIGNQVEADLTLTGDTLTGVSVNPSSVAPGGSSTGTVTLSGPAPVGGWVVKLWAGAPSDVQVPATVTVPAGATSATFSISTAANAHPSTYGVFANDGTAQFETLLTIT